MLTSREKRGPGEAGLEFVHENSASPREHPIETVPGGLAGKARTAIGSARNDCFVSVASAWQIAIKVSLGKLRIEGALDRFVPEQLAANGFQALPIDLKHTARVATLPFHHRDPFDRLLVAQAMDKNLAVVTADPAFVNYGVKRVW